MRRFISTPKSGTPGFSVVVKVIGVKKRRKRDNISYPAIYIRDDDGEQRFMHKVMEADNCGLFCVLVKPDEESNGTLADGRRIWMSVGRGEEKSVFGFYHSKDPQRFSRFSSRHTPEWTQCSECKRFEGDFENDA